MLTTDGKFAYNAQTPRDREKVCAKCRRWGELADFPANGKASSGRSSWCRSCHRDAVRDWRRRKRPASRRKPSPGGPQMTDPAVRPKPACARCGAPMGPGAQARWDLSRLCSRGCGRSA
jgi:hypothetical protein